MTWRTSWDNEPHSSATHWTFFLLLACFLTYNITQSIASVYNDQVAAVVAQTTPSLLPRISKPIPDSYIVVFANDVSDVSATAKQLASQHGASVKFTYTSAFKGAALEHLPSQAVEALKRNPKIALIEQDQTVFSTDTTQSPVPSWGLDRIDQSSLPLSGTYTYQGDGTGVNVYVIDTGIRHTHVQFGGRVVPAFNSISDTYGPDGCHWHGTHVAGTVGGSTVGVARGVTLYSVRVLDCGGSGTESGVLAGIDWVTANRKLPAVANMSLGAGASTIFNNAVENSIASGITYVIAAGNSSTDACGFTPASVPAAITVGATMDLDAQSLWSNYGPCVDLYAPGESIYSAVNTSDTAMELHSGTSMAAPHVTGAAALYLQTHPTASPAEVAQAIVLNATPRMLGSLGPGSPNLLLRMTNLSGISSVPLPPADTTPPSVPTNLTAATPDSTHVNLSWSASTDNVGITSYKIYKNGSPLTAVTGTSYIDASVIANTSYTYAVAAVDGAGNMSPQSAPVVVTTPQVVVPPPTASFSIGDFIHTTSKVNVRSTPSTKGKAAGTQKANATGVIIGGPQVASGYTWWQVDFTSGTDGWVVQDYISK